MKSAAGGHAMHYKILIDTDSLISRIDAAAKQAVTIASNEIKAQSNAIAPLKKGALIASSQAEFIKTTTARISYNTVYARYQHERTDLNHPNGRQPKYLQSVIDNPATARIMLDAFADALKL